MTEAFRDYCINVLGTPRHWWRMDGAVKGTETDVGDSGVLRSFTGALDASLTAMNVRQAGVLQRDTINYATTWTNARYNGVSMGLGNWFADTTKGTVSWCFKSSSATTQIMLGSHPPAGAWNFLMTSAGAVRFDVINGANSTTQLSTPTGYNDGAMHLVDVVCDAVNANKMYIDGEIVATTQSPVTLGTHPWLADLIAAGAGEFYLGNDQRAPGASNFPFVGTLDEIQFWDEILTESQIRLKWQATQFSAAGLRTSRGRKSLAFP